jgi:hypothetical protein
MSHTRIHRQQFASRVSSKRALLPVWIISSFVFALLVAVLIKQYLDNRPQRSDVAVASLDPGVDLSISAQSLARGSIHLYAIKSSGQELRFLIQRTNENVIHVAAATCRSCYRSSQLHYAHHGVFYCGQCRQAMHCETRDPGLHDGCSMPEIPHSESKGNLIVRASDVKATYDTEFQQKRDVQHVTN